jgi:hypothetical protein
MRIHIPLTVLAGTILAALALAGAARAQMQLELKELCGRPSAEYTIPVGDHPGHAFRIQQTDCAPEGTAEIAGVAIQKHQATGFTEIDAARGAHQWFHVFTMADGAQVFARSQGTAQYQGRRFQSSTSKWTLEGGTGKFEKLRGGGTYTCHPAAGGFACEAQGGYRLPTP